MLRTIALLLVALAVGLGVAACGDDDDAGSTTTEETTTTEDTTTTDDTTTEETTTEETTTEETTAVGREVFVANCGSCHTLSDAGTTGTVGPSLDGAALAADAVEQQVRSGGGGMPAFADTLSAEEIQEVSAYVAASSG